MQDITLRNGKRIFSANRYGDLSAPMVLCLHGFPDNANSFRHQVVDLVAAGFQVLTPTMRGYEPSSIIDDSNYDIAELAGDVFAWLDQLGTGQVHLVGHDWGSVVAHMAAARDPERFLSMVTMAVPHPGRFIENAIKKVPAQGLKSWYMLFNQIPGLSDYVVQYNDFAFLRWLWRRWSPDFQLGSQEWQDLVTTFSQPGVVRAMLSYYRQNVSPAQLLGLRPSSAGEIRQIRVPNLAITGVNDGCIDTRVYEHTVFEHDFPADVRIKRIDGAGHFVHQEKPETVNALMIDWFHQHQKTT